MNGKSTNILGIIMILTVAITLAYANTVKMDSISTTTAMDGTNYSDKNMELNDFNAIPTDENVSLPDKNLLKDKEPIYEPVSTMKETEQTVENTGSEMNETREKSAETMKETEDQMRAKGETENVKYERSDSVSLPIPVEMKMTNAKVGEVEIRGIMAETKCDGGKCVIVMPKDEASQKELLHLAITMAVEQMGVANKVHVVQTAVIERNGFMVAKVVAAEENKLRVMYATADQGAFAVISEIPKEVLPDINLIEGNVVFLETDPVLKIYLKAENNEIAVSGYTVTKDVNFISKDRVEFAVCAVRITDVSVTENGDRYILSFRVMDGTTPVYVPNVRIAGPGTSVIPQYDDIKKRYTATLSKADGIKIVANVSGCGEITYYVQKPENTSNNSLPVVISVAVMAILLAGWYLWKG